MARLVALLALVACSTLGCGRLGIFESPAAADASDRLAQNGDQLARQVDADDDQADAERRESNDDEPKSRIVRAILEALEEIDEDDEETNFDDEAEDFDTAGERREYIEQILRESDEELYRVLEDNPRQAILRANQRRPHVVIAPGTLPVAAAEESDAEADDESANEAAENLDQENQ